MNYIPATLGRLRPSTRALSLLSATAVNALSNPRVAAGIGLGSDAAWLVRRGRGLVAEQPSVLAVDTRIREIGKAAGRLEGREPSGVVVSRPLSAGSVLHREHAVALVRRLLQGASGSVILAVPHQLTSAQRRTLEQVVRQAGAGRIYSVEEPLVSAVGAGLPVLEPRAVMTLDIGATRTTLSVMALGQIVLSEVIPLGGRAMDDAIMDYLKTAHRLLIGRPTAERVKKTIGCAVPLATPTAMDVDGMSLETHLPTRVTLSSMDVCRALQPVLSAIGDHLRASLERMPAPVLADVTRPEAMVLVGGGSALAHMADFISKRTHLSPTVALAPQHALAAGIDQLLSSPRLRRELLSAPSTVTAPAVRGVTRRSNTLSYLLGLLSILLIWQAVAPLAARTTGMDRTLTAALLPVWRTFNSLKPLAPSALAAGTDTPGLRAQLREQDRRLQLALAENHRLRSLVHMAGKLPASAQYVSGQVVARDPAAWLQDAVLDVGRRQHVTPGMAVVSDSQVVGRIGDVGDASAHLHTLTFPGAITASQVASRHAAGVVYGVDGRTCEMRYIDSNAGVRPGDLVTTSGQDRFPEGLVVGRITSIRASGDGASMTATVRPGVSLDSLRDVLVLQRR